MVAGHHHRVVSIIYSPRFRVAGHNDILLLNAQWDTLQDWIRPLNDGAVEAVIILREV